MKRAKEGPPFVGAFMKVTDIGDMHVLCKMSPESVALQ
jgi:hypothetical protein